MVSASDHVSPTGRMRQDWTSERTVSGTEVKRPSLTRGFSTQMPPPTATETMHEGIKKREYGEGVREVE